MTTPRPLNTGSHDLPVSAALDAFMGTGWAPTQLPAEDRVPGYAAMPSRRARLAAAYPGERLIVPAGQLKVRSYDCDYRFRPHSAYAWLTGLTGEEQVGHVLVIEPNGEPVLYLRPRSPRGGGSPYGSEFYRDRRYGEFWVGRRPDLAEAEQLTGIRTAHLDDLEKLLTGAQPVTRLLGGADPVLEALLPTAVDTALAGTLSELRLVKDAWEVEQLQLSVDATTAGFEDVIRALPAAFRHGRGERWLEGTFNLRARAEGNGTATRPSSPPARTPACCTGSATTAPSTPRSCCCWTRAWRSTRSTPPTSPAPSHSAAPSPPSSARSTNSCWPPRRRASPPCAPAPASGTSTGPACG